MNVQRQPVFGDSDHESEQRCSPPSRSANVIPIRRLPKKKLPIGTTLYLDVASLALSAIGADGTKLVRDSAGKWTTEWAAARIGKKRKQT